VLVHAAVIRPVQNAPAGYESPVLPFPDSSPEYSGCINPAASGHHALHGSLIVLNCSDHLSYFTTCLQHSFGSKRQTRDTAPVEFFIAGGKLREPGLSSGVRIDIAEFVGKLADQAQRLYLADYEEEFEVVP